MGREAAENLPEARAFYDRAADILGYDLAAICFEGPEQMLDSTRHSQPALLVTSLAAVESLRKRAPEVVRECQAAAGLSLGEYTALVMAEALDFESGLRLVQTRGEAMQEAADATPGGMVSILGLDQRQVQDLCDQARGEETLEIANLLCPGNIVVSGENVACERVADLARKGGAMKVVPLAVAGAFHTSIMNSVVDRLGNVLEQVKIKRPAIPVISNVDAQPHDDPDQIRRLLVRQVIAPVRWEESIRYLLDEGYGQFYEVGPGRVLQGLLRRIDRGIPCQNVAA
jgi:[acyl-carrier-protein] S-malonyltransferase